MLPTDPEHDSLAAYVEQDANALEIEILKAEISALRIAQASAYEARHSYNAEKQIDAPPMCVGCGGPHPFDTTIPSTTWNRIIRGAGLPDYLCTTCIVKAFAMAGETFTAQLWGDGFSGLPVEFSVAGVTATSHAEMSEENTQLRARLTKTSEPKMFPIQSERGHRAHPTEIPWSVADRAYSVYRADYGDGQSLERLAQRGGFAPSEMDGYYPAWEQESSEIVQLQARIGRLEKALARDRGCAECWRGVSCGTDCRMRDVLEGRDE